MECGAGSCARDVRRILAGGATAGTSPPHTTAPRTGRSTEAEAGITGIMSSAHSGRRGSADNLSGGFTAG